jgi:hypothetical protein
MLSRIQFAFVVSFHIFFLEDASIFACFDRLPNFEHPVIGRSFA